MFSNHLHSRKNIPSHSKLFHRHLGQAESPPHPHLLPIQGFSNQQAIPFNFIICGNAAKNLPPIIYHLEAISNHQQLIALSTDQAKTRILQIPSTLRHFPPLVRREVIFLAPPQSVFTLSVSCWCVKHQVLMTNISRLILLIRS